MDTLARTETVAETGLPEVVDGGITAEDLTNLFTWMKKVTKWMPKLI